MLKAFEAYFSFLSSGVSMTEEKESMAISTAETFVEHFYGRMDTKRHAVDKLYLDRAVVAWNGNKLEGRRGVGQLLMGTLFSSPHFRHRGNPEILAVTSRE